MRVIIILILFLFAHNLVFCQSDSSKYDYSMIEYEILNRDTVTISCTNGLYNQPGYKSWDSTFVRADIILYILPVIINEDSVHKITVQILSLEKIQDANLWRHKHYLPWRKFSYMPEGVRKQYHSSYIGRLKLNDEKIKFGFFNN